MLCEYRWLRTNMIEDSRHHDDLRGPATIPRVGAIVIVDLAGFTSLVLEQGTDAALARIWRMRSELVPHFQQHGGEIYKVDADNLLIFFSSLQQAVEAALGSHERVRTFGFQVSVGVGFGTLHYLASEDDYYGEQVNLAAKLGEDVAAAGETLLTMAAFEELPEETRTGERKEILLGKLQIAFFTL